MGTHLFGSATKHFELLVFTTFSATSSHAFNLNA